MIHMDCCVVLSWCLSITFHVLKCVGHSVCRVLQGLLIFVSQNSFNHPEVNGFWLHGLVYFNQIWKEHVQIVQPIYSCFSPPFHDCFPASLHYPSSLLSDGSYPAKESGEWFGFGSYLSLTLPYEIWTCELAKCLKWSLWLIQAQNIFMFYYKKKCITLKKSFYYFLSLLNLK